MRYLSSILAALSITIMLAACGGGGGDAAPTAPTNPNPNPPAPPPPPPPPPPAPVTCASGVPDNTPPTAAISFPLAGVYSDGEEITVFGTAADDDCVETLEVSGIAATSDDDFAHWEATVPVQPGANVLTVSVVDGSGNSNNAAATLTFVGIGPLLRQPTDLALDIAGNRLLIVDRAFRRLLEYDLNTGSVSVVSDINHGTGARMLSPVLLAVDSSANTAYVFDDFFNKPNPNTLLSIDLASGDRGIIADATTGFGMTMPNNLNSLALDPRTFSRLFMLTEDNAQEDIIVTQDLSTDIRALFAGNTIGSGPLLDRTRQLIFDSVSNRLLLPDQSADRILAIDPDSGQRSDVTNLTGGSGFNFDNPGAGAFDATGNRLLLINEEFAANPVAPTNSLISVDLSGLGQHTLLVTDGGADPRLDSGPVAYNDASNDFYVLDGAGSRRLESINVITGQRTALLDQTRGSGPELRNVWDIVLDDVNNQVYLSDTQTFEILRIDLASGDRTVVSDSSQVIGANNPQVYDLILDRANDRLLARQGNFDTVIAIDINTGAQSVISGDAGNTVPMVGTGPLLYTIVSLALDEQNGRLFVLSNENGIEGVYEIDPATGDRIIISDQANGVGLPLQRPDEMVYDPLFQRLLVSARDASQDPGISVYSIDPDTGNRDFISISATSLPRGSIAINVATRRLYSVRSSSFMGYMDLDTGQVRQFSSSFFSQQPDLYPSNFVVPGNADYIIATDNRLDAVLAISLVNGDYVVISR